MIGHTRTRLKTGVTRVSGVTNDHNHLNLLNFISSYTDRMRVMLGV